MDYLISQFISLPTAIQHIMLGALVGGFIYFLTIFCVRRKVPIISRYPVFFLIFVSMLLIGQIQTQLANTAVSVQIFGR